jgi:hypothetical protein
MNNLRLPSHLNKNANYHMFKNRIKPMWEDPANAKVCTSLDVKSRNMLSGGKQGGTDPIPGWKMDRPLPLLPPDV